MSKFLFFIFSIVLLFSTGCVDDTNNAETDEMKTQLTQYWELTEAKRNGKKTDSMVDAYLDFSGDGTVMVNLDGTAQKAKWNITEGNIHISETNNAALSTDYLIKEINDNSLVLSLKMRNTPFVFSFAKAEKDAKD